jgi:photosystem II stability/assembly factor-like uncharacterized protein
MKYVMLIIVVWVGALSALSYHGCALASDNQHGWVVCIDTALIFHTTNGGSVWEQQTVPPGSRRFFDITCSSEAKAWTIGILGEILYTTNGGTNWLWQIEGLSKYGTRIEFIDDTLGWAACGDGAVGRTTNGGTYWDQVFTPWIAEYYGISFVNDQTGWMVAGYPDSFLVGQGMILKSSNGGIIWDSLYFTETYEDFFDVHFFHLLNGVVVGGDEADSSALILRTTNGGSNWTYITPPANTYYLRAVDFVGDEGWAVGMHGSIVHTTDQGATWEPLTSPVTNTLFDVDFSDNLHGLACGYNKILYTSDGGQNWGVTAVDETFGSDVSVTRFKCLPNPCCNVLFVDLDCNEAFYSTVVIYDIAGNAVKTLYTGTRLPSQLVWDRTDALGQRVPAGVYLVNVRTGNTIYTDKVVVLD